MDNFLSLFFKRRNLCKYIKTTVKKRGQIVRGFNSAYVYYLFLNLIRDMHIFLT